MTSSNPTPTSSSATLRSDPPTGSNPTSAGAVTTAECTREAVAESLGYRPDEVLSDPVCHDGWGRVSACPASERDPEVGCIHAGKIIRAEGDQWVYVAALLQTYAENFTAYGAPPDVAEKLYPRCF